MQPLIVPIKFFKESSPQAQGKNFASGPPWACRDVRDSTSRSPSFTMASFKGAMLSEAVSVPVTTPGLFRGVLLKSHLLVVYEHSLARM